MSTLEKSAEGEVRLTLSGPDEERILATLRRWPQWLRAEVERDPVDASRTLAVTLIADQSQEATLREILRRSFGLVFPPEGGSAELTPLPPPKPSRRGFPPRRS
jgi:hypothetical protein